MYSSELVYFIPAHVMDTRIVVRGVRERIVMSVVFLVLCMILFYFNMDRYTSRPPHMTRGPTRARKTFPEFIWRNSSCQDDGMVNSIEYQLKIDHHLFEGNRNDVISEFVSFFASITGLSHYDIMHNGYWNCLEEYEVKTLHTCGHPRHTFRIRNYLSGANQTMSTVDVQVNAFGNITWACAQPFEIAPQYRNENFYVFDKLEHGKLFLVWGEIFLTLLD